MNTTQEQVDLLKRQFEYLYEGERDRKICMYIAVGYNNQSIALAVGTQTRIVRRRIRALCKKCGFANKKELREACEKAILSKKGNKEDVH